MRNRPKYSRDYTIKLVSSALFDRNIGVFPDPKNISHLVCISPDLTKRVGVRVVKNNNSIDTWTLTHESIKDYDAGDLFFIFVGYRSEQKPKLYVVPSSVVLNKTDDNATGWLSSLRKDGKPHKNIGTRKFVLTPKERKDYLNRWNLLGL